MALGCGGSLPACAYVADAPMKAAQQNNVQGFNDLVIVKEQANGGNYQIALKEVQAERPDLVSYYIGSMRHVVR